MSSHPSAPVSEARIRRVPRYGVFLLLGAVFGAIVTLVLTFAFDGVLGPSEIGVSYSRGQVFGFLLLFCVAGGVALGAIVALILDRTVGRRSQTVHITRETIVPND